MNAKQNINLITKCNSPSMNNECVMSSPPVNIEALHIPSYVLSIALDNYKYLVYPNKMWR